MRQLCVAAVLAALFCLAAGTDAQQPAKKADPKAKTDPKAKEEPESRFNMKIKTSDIKLGTQLTGEKLEVENLKGKVVMVDFWGVNCGPCLAAMPGTAAMNAELADFGLVVIGSHVQEALPDQIKSVAASKGANFPITIQTRVVGANDFQTIPHVMVFDHTGACIFRGMPQEAEHKARLAVGEMIVAGAEREKFSSALNPVVSDLKKGKPPLSVLPRLVGLQNAATKEAGEEAKALLASVTASGQKKLEAAQEKIDSAPVDAYLMVEKLPTAFKGTPVAKQANEMINKLKKDKAVTTELSARTALDALRKIESQLATKPGADEASKPEFQKANAALLKQLKDKVAQMKKIWPDAKATTEAVAVGEKYAPAPK